MYAYNRMGRELGSGQFGLIKEGMWKNSTKSIKVAVKCLKEGVSSSEKVKFLQEAAIMAQFRHPNVVTMYGVVSNGENVRESLATLTVTVQ